MPFASAEELFASKSPFQTKRENEWPLVLCAAHFDESHEKPGLAVAGYSAAIDSWWRLDCQWQALLKRWNLKYFKASEFFFFSSRRRHTRSLRDWSSNVCSSD